VQNFNVTTEDGVILKGWLFNRPCPSQLERELLREVANVVEKKKEVEKEVEKEVVKEVVKEVERVVIYFHGTGSTRALGLRLRTVQSIAANLNAQVISFDYRGFGDSTGWVSFNYNWGFKPPTLKFLLFLSTAFIYLNVVKPSEFGTHLDARAIWQWINEKLERDGVRSPVFYLYGHSLGTAIATALAVEANKRRGEEGMAVGRKGVLVANQQNYVQGLILDSPFTTLTEASMAHPLGAPFRIFSFVKELM
jgi:pimeloyl-ACP methyl ester carboxylesterase